jgi:sulfotransferase family protein
MSPSDFEAYSQHTYNATQNGFGQGERLIFVGGPPRSGTTLVQNMLDCHGQIYGGPEFLHLPDIVRVRSKMHASISRKWIDLICSYDQVDRMTAAWIEAFLLPLADARGSRFLSEKTPENVLVFPELIALFPKARFLFVVRDPRAIVSSLLEVGAKARAKKLKPPYFTRDLTAAISYTRNCLEKGFKAVDAARERVYMVMYERLVYEPEQETRGICDFLGLIWEPTMIRPASKEHAGKGAATIYSNELWYNAQTFNRDPTSDRVDDWRRRLSPRDQITIALWFRSSRGLRALGYDFSVDSYSPATRFFGTGKSQFLRVRRRISSQLGQYLQRLQEPPSPIV